MSTKKQREELKSALSSWVFEGIANEWTTTELLEAVAKDWHKIVKTYTPSSLKELSAWQGTVLDMLGVGTSREIADKQREADAALILWSTADMPPASVTRALVQELAGEILAGVAVRRGTDVNDTNAVVLGSPGSTGIPTVPITIIQ